MIDFLAPLETFDRSTSDYNRSDRRSEFEQLLQRQDMTERVLRGEVSSDELLDCLNDQGIDPDEYSRVVVDNIEYVLRQEIEINPETLGFILPGSGLWVPGIP